MKNKQRPLAEIKGNKQVTATRYALVVWIGTNRHIFLLAQTHMSLVVRKPVFGVSNQVRYNRAVQSLNMGRGLKY